MILVPEIALTPQMMARFTAYFGRKVALLHSGLRLTERWDQYKRIRRGAHIVLGTRSAVFRPAGEPGLDHTGRGAGELLRIGKKPLLSCKGYGKIPLFPENARLLLGSATPHGGNGMYARTGGLSAGAAAAALQRPPDAPGDPGGYAPGAAGRQQRAASAGELMQELEKNLEAGEQSILFLNRRGSSRELLCPPVRLCAPVPPVQRVSDLSLRQSADDVPLLRLFRKSSEACPRAAAP